jgi:pimeloyl-ACP methyl ester carboxylesterase
MCRHLDPIARPGPGLPHGAVLLCPAGLPRGDAAPTDPRWTWPGDAETAAEVRAAIAALRARYGARLLGPPLLFGFSLGASRAARLATAAPAEFPALLLWEGGAPQLRGRPLRRYLAGGGVVRVGCSEVRCEAQARGVCAGTTDARCATFALPDIGHRVEPPFGSAIREVLLTLLPTGSESPR